MTVTGEGRLTEGVLHFWCLPRNRERSERLCETGALLLSQAERARLKAIKSADRARQFVLGRVLLRRALAYHLDCDPGQLRFSEQSSGKLSLTWPEEYFFDFSLSHSGSDFLVAVARARGVGVDIEELHRAVQVLKIARSVFPPAEHEQFDGQDDGEAAEAALSLWSLKESVAKAIGGTIWQSIGKAVMSVERGSLTWLAPPPEGEQADWTLLLGAFREDHRFAAALWHPASYAKGWRWELHCLDEQTRDREELQITPMAGL
ncbi:4'-phosphopantetheinyl transferase family protein [Pelagibius marinus]|uniref:4'-phosphopantetheinyl transferase family protein n=1 Tax=Pelagibius marinus TaxID=2762760 RepID=UPI001872DFE2|nr:4'-phosphopantetheinyl transferase superfamily protein [Pelagibius marinus]